MNTPPDLFTYNADEDETIVPLDQQESEEDVHPDPMRINESVLFNTDWTVETLYRQIEKGNINLNPKFQRREAWNIERKSRFIESMVCSLPIPNVVLAEDRAIRGRYIVIDGKQRLFSIASFLRGEFVLRGLTIRSDLNGRSFTDLQTNNPQDGNTIENYTIRTVVIRNWPDEDYLYTVFYRLNSGSLQLSSQELRKALHAGNLLDYLDDFVRESEAFKTIFGDKLDPRMRDVELVLRFVAFDNSFTDYKGELKPFLDQTVKYFDGNWTQSLPALQESLSRLTIALETTRAVFGTDAFKKWNGNAFERRSNRAVFDVITRYFSDLQIADRSKGQSAAVVESFKALCAENESFRNSIERTTKTPTATWTRHTLWGEKLASIIGAKLDLHSMRLV